MAADVDAYFASLPAARPNSPPFVTGKGRSDVPTEATSPPICSGG